jgi:class 3 adenylate cyclase
LPVVCVKCGSLLPASAKFCPECAHPVRATPVTPPPPVTPAAYTPKHLAEKILTSKRALEGERKQVTVLFADLRGSMELLADRDPEEARRILDPVLERMMDAVHRYEGTVNQVMGDGIMALFGAPLAHEDHALRACYAALAMRSAIHRYAEEVQASLGLDLQIRIGLNSGEVVVRTIGSDLHMDYTAVGQTTHLAARMEQIATPGSIRLTAETRRLTEGLVEIASLGPMPLKGLSEPVEVFELTGASATRTRLQAAVARGLSELVGRRVELETLHRAREKATAGRGHVVAVVGEPGVGKSRLFWEFVHSEPLRGWLLLTSGSVSYGRATAYLPVVNLLKAYFEVEDRDDATVIRAKVTEKVLGFGDALKPAMPALLTLLDTPVEDERWRSLDPAQRRQRTLDAVKGLLLRESQRQPVLLMVEDLHWIDSETQALLDGLADSLPTVRILLLVNYRPEYQHGWGSKTYYTQVRLDPLPADSAEELLQTLLGRDPELRPLMGILIERTEGNPFFLEESVRALVETRVLVGEPGTYRLARPVETVQVPPTVQAVLAARIDRLDPAHKHLLQSAAVIGKDVPVVLLESIAEAADEELRRGLAHLQAAEFLYQAALFPEPEYTFKHALTLEVAYQSLLRERRRVLHERVLLTLERLFPDRVSEKVELLAHHAVRGEVWDRAARYLYQAGEKALAQARPKAAAASYEATVDALDRLGAAGDRTLKLDAYLELWVTRISTGQLDSLRELGERAEALARSLNDGPRLAKVQVRQAQAMAITWLVPGTFDAAIERAREAFDRANPGDLRTRGYAQYIAGLSCRDTGRFHDAIREYGRGVALFPTPEQGAEAGLVFPIYVSLCAWRSEVYAALGAFEDALASATEALRMAGEIRHPSSLTLGDAYLGYVHILRGDVEAGLPYLERGLAIGQEHDLIHGIMANGLYLAYGLLLLGERERGLDCLARALQKSVGAFTPQWTRYGTVTASAYLAADRSAEAPAEIEQGLALASERGARGYRAPLLRLRAEALARRPAGDTGRARQCLDEALAVATELGMRPEIAHCHAGLAWVHRRAGERSAAETHLATATALFRGLGMTFWAIRAEAASKDPP